MVCNINNQNVCKCDMEMHEKFMKMQVVREYAMAAKNQWLLGISTQMDANSWSVTATIHMAPTKLLTKRHHTKLRHGNERWMHECSWLRQEKCMSIMQQKCECRSRFDMEWKHLAVVNF